MFLHIGGILWSVLNVYVSLLYCMAFNNLIVETSTKLCVILVTICLPFAIHITVPLLLFDEVLDPWQEGQLP